MQHHVTHPVVLFKKNDGLLFLQNKVLVQIMAFYARSIQSLDERKLLVSTLELLIKLAHFYKKRDIYDGLAIRFISDGFFYPLLLHYENKPMSEAEYSGVARMLELCACHPEGIQIMHHHLQMILRMLKIFLNHNLDIQKIKYPAATVLLDLTASETCIEGVAKDLMNLNLFNTIFKELNVLLGDNIEGVLYSRLRDLFIGIVLNLTCNVEDDQVSFYMLEKGVVVLLSKYELLNYVNHSFIEFCLTQDKIGPQMDQL